MARILMKNIMIRKFKLISLIKIFVKSKKRGNYQKIIDKATKKK